MLSVKAKRNQESYNSSKTYNAISKRNLFGRSKAATPSSARKIWHKENPTVIVKIPKYYMHSYTHLPK